MASIPLSGGTAFARSMARQRVSHNHPRSDLQNAVVKENHEVLGEKDAVLVEMLSKEQANLPVECDEQLVRRLIEWGTIFDEKIMVRFRSCLETNVKSRKIESQVYVVRKQTTGFFIFRQSMV